MPALRIPEKYRPGLAVLSAMSDETFETLVVTLNTAPAPPRGQEELTAWVSSKVAGLSQSDIKRLIETLASLYRLRVRATVKVETLAVDVAEAVSKNTDLKAPSDLLKNRLVRLLSIGSLNLVDAKAKELQLEAEHMFCDARIITDLRPVFGSNVQDSPEAMIIVNTLKLGYHDSGEQQHAEIYFALDSDDISKMIDVLKRAQDKAKTLKQKLDSVGIRAIDFS